MNLFKYFPQFYFAAEGGGSTGAADSTDQGAGKGAADQTGADDKGQVPIKALHEERTKRQQLEARMKQFETVMGDQFAYDAQGNVIPRNTQAAAAPASTTQQAGGGWEDYRRQLDVLWENDPRKAMQTEMNTAIGWYDQVNSSVEDQLDQLAEKVKDFSQYRSTIRQYLRKLPLDQRARPGIVEAAYYLQKGRGVDQIIETERKTWNQRLEQVDGIQGLPGGSGAVPAGDGGGRRFTQEEVSVARMYGQTPEEYFGKKG